MTEQKKLYRSVKDRKIAGVAGGLAEHFNIDPVIIRIVFVCAFLFAGGGLFVYIILWIVTPEEPANLFSANNSTEKATAENEHETTKKETNNNNTTENMENQFDPIKEKKKNKGNLTGGLVLITLGVLFLIARFVPHIYFHDLWPILLIVIGVSMLMRNLGKKNNN
ncbi:MAG: PspC domain-containing protein [Bacteroidetes bacterium]|nr:PspC domain-containing protein [Bacteroidota bacterium]